MATPMENTSPSTEDIILAVDLDGTLSRSDTLHEGVLRAVATMPGAVPGLIGALREGKPAFKRAVAKVATVPGDALVLNKAVLAEIGAAKEAGRTTVLVTAADKAQADAVADMVGLFDAVLATGSAEAEGENLGGAAKARLLTRLYGEKGFDYIGDAEVDLPVWSAARRAVTVGADARLRAKVEAANLEVLHLDPPPVGASKARTALRAMRPHQWAKNVLVFVPMLAAQDLSAFPAALAAFVAFSLTASSVYLVNDLLDLAADRAHPRKCKRPFAAGELSIAFGVRLAIALILAATLVAVIGAQPVFLVSLASYYFGTCAYSFWLKRKLVIDIMALGGLYTARVIAGSAATGVALSPWMMAFSMFLFLALAAVKRQAELTDQISAGKDSAPGRAYEAIDLPIVRSIAIGSAHAAVLVLALYITSPDVLSAYGDPSLLWVLCPILLYWTLRMVMVAHRGRMSDDPIVFAFTDPASRMMILAAAVVLIAATYL